MVKLYKYDVMWRVYHTAFFNGKENKKQTGRLGVEASFLGSGCHRPVCVALMCSPGRWRRLSHGLWEPSLRLHGPSPTPIPSHSSGISSVCGVPTRTYLGLLAVAGPPEPEPEFPEVTRSGSRLFLLPCSHDGPIQL